MPRGRRSNLTLDEKLENTLYEIANTENRLVELNRRKDELEIQIRQQRLSELDEMISLKGLSIADIKKMIDETN